MKNRILEIVMLNSYLKNNYWIILLISSDIHGVVIEAPSLNVIENELENLDDNALLSSILTTH